MSLCKCPSACVYQCCKCGLHFSKWFSVQQDKKWQRGHIEPLLFPNDQIHTHRDTRIIDVFLCVLMKSATACMKSSCSQAPLVSEWETNSWLRVQQAFWRFLSFPGAGCLGSGAGLPITHCLLQFKLLQENSSVCLNMIAQFFHPFNDTVIVFSPACGQSDNA